MAVTGSPHTSTIRSSSRQEARPSAQQSLPRRSWSGRQWVPQFHGRRSDEGEGSNGAASCSTYSRTAYSPPSRPTESKPSGQKSRGCWQRQGLSPVFGSWRVCCRGWQASYLGSDRLYGLCGRQSPRPVLRGRSAAADRCRPEPPLPTKSGARCSGSSGGSMQRQCRAWRGISR